MIHLKRLPKKGVSPVIATIIYSPVRIIRWVLDLDKKVELILDNCPPGFDFTEAGRIPVEKIERSID